MDTRNPQREQEALTEGRRAGQLRLGAGLNPHDMGTPEYAEWERGRSTTEAKLAAEALRARARRVSCWYTAGCDCGGRGLCLDVA